MKNLIISFLLLSSPFLLAQSDKDLAASSVSKNKIEGHIYFLASDELRGRETGTLENKIASQYLANMLRSYGALTLPGKDSYFQQVPMIKRIGAKEKDITVNGLKYENLIPLSGENLDYDGPAVFLNYGLPEDYSGQDVTGKVVMVRAGTGPGDDARAMFDKVQDKRELAKKNGAIALVELAPVNSRLWQFLEHNFSGNSVSLAENEEDTEQDNFSYLWLQDTNGAIANDLSSKRAIFTNIKINGIKEDKFFSRNVVAMIPGTDPKLKNEYIIYSAHYDHVGVGTPNAAGDSIYNGAVDNAVGVTTVLAMAENLAKNPTKRSALFILFTGEEKGLLGSRYYAENPELPLESMVFAFNSDNAGYNNTDLITVIGLTRTTAEKHIRKAASAFGLTAIDDPAPEQNLFDRSDNVSFAAKGVPSPTFSVGFDSFTGRVVEHYHQPSDEPDIIDYDYMVKFFRSYVYAGRLIANDAETPFWVKGDKYEEAGKKLYGKK